MPPFQGQRVSQATSFIDSEDGGCTCVRNVDGLLHGVIFYKVVIFTDTAWGTSNPKKDKLNIFCVLFNDAVSSSA
jgi:hypothetical protein